MTATVSVEKAADAEATWIEEAISYTLGDAPVVRQVERWAVNPVLDAVIRRGTRQAFRRLAAILEGRVAVHPPDREPG